MTFITADRIKETTTVTGTGPITLLGAVPGYRSFASVMLSIGDTCPYAIVNANASQWEVGIATYTDVNTLTRTTIHASTADPNTEPVNFAAGVKDVFLAPTARTVLSDLTSNDGTVTLSKVGPIVDLSVAIAAATENVIVQVRNTTGATLTKGTVVYINNALGQLPTVAKALATSDATSAQTLGMISADLDNNSNGYVTIIGLIDDISLDTGIYNDGDQLYLSGTTAGAFTNVKPYAPTHLVYVGVVEHAHNVHGKIFVKVQNGYELDELHNVSAQSPSNGQTIVYNSTNQLWEKNTVSLTNGVNGILPVTNGGTGAASGNYFVTGSSSFSPLDFSPLLWLDANDSATVYQDSGLSVLATADGQTVAGWKDKSGNNRHLTQSLGGNTSLLKTGANGLNGLRGIKFNGSTSYFNFSSFSASGNYTAFHVFSLPIGTVFAKTISNSISNSRYTAAVNNTNLINDASLYAMRFTGNDGYYSTSGASALQSPQCCVYQIIGNAAVGFKQNRKPVWPTVTSGNANYTNTTYSIFGKDLDAAGSQISGEFIYIPSVLTAAQINLFESYLCAKWSIK